MYYNAKRIRDKFLCSWRIFFIIIGILGACYNTPSLVEVGLMTFLSIFCQSKNFLCLMCAKKIFLGNVFIKYLKISKINFERQNSFFRETTPSRTPQAEKWQFLSLVSEMCIICATQAQKFCLMYSKSISCLTINIRSTPLLNKYISLLKFKNESRRAMHFIFKDTLILRFWVKFCLVLGGGSLL